MRESWTEQQGRAAIEQWRASGETLERFATRLGVGKAKLSYWRAKTNAAVKKTAAPALVAVRVRPRASTRGAADGAQAAEVLVSVRGVVAIGKAHAVDPKWVAALARELAATA